MSDTLDVGVSMTITYAMLEAGLTGSGNQVHDIGFRGTLGARKSMGPMTIGLYYQTEQEHQYDNLHVTSFDGVELTNLTGLSNLTGDHTAYVNANNLLKGKCNGDGGNVCRQDVEIEQPWNVGLGVSMDMGNNLLVMADVTHKKWSDAKFFSEFYDDQNVVSIGVQKTMGNLKLRAGYGYADDPLLSQVSKVSKFRLLVVNVAGAAYSSPMYGLFMSYLLWKHQLSTRVAVGLGVENFLGVPFLSLDTHAAVQLEEDKCFGSGQVGLATSKSFGAAIGTALGAGLAADGCTSADHTKATVSSFHLGGALTWSF